MPFTPFHCGPALVIKSCAPQKFSLSTFLFVQFLIDLESLYHLINGDQQVHAFFHTYVGASLIVLLVIFLWLGPVNFLLRKNIFKISQAPQQTFSKTSVVFAAIFGAYSHVALDSIMHSDIRPLAPFFISNTLFRWVSLETLHNFCVFTGIAGLLIFGLRFAISALKNKA